MRILLSLVTIAALFGADDPWAKVKAIDSGSELRVYKRNSSQPLNVKMDQATDDRLLVVQKNEQVSIPKADIDRIDVRPTHKSSVTRQSKTVVEGVEGRPPVTRPDAARVPSTTSSSSVSFGGKPDFETVYRRAPSTSKP